MALPHPGLLPKEKENCFAKSMTQKRCLAMASLWLYRLMAMNVAIEIPENVSASLRSRWKDVPRRALEAVAAEAYRSGALTAHQVGELLGHGSRWETEAFLKQAQAYLHYSEDDLERDLAALRAARG
jgi:predicted HTH domain antitoxin